MSISAYDALTMIRDASVKESKRLEQVSEAHFESFEADSSSWTKKFEELTAAIAVQDAIWKSTSIPMSIALRG